MPMISRNLRPHHFPPPTSLSQRTLVKAMFLCFVFMLIELAGGIIGHSLAVMSDALHMLTDVFSFALAIYATVVSKQASTSRFSYGFKRVEVLFALLSTLLIWVLTAVLLYEAAIRITEYQAGVMEDVDGRVMFAIAAIGIAFNLVLERVLGDSGHGHSHGGHSDGHAHGGSGGPTEQSPLFGAKVSDENHSHAAHDHEHHGHDHAPPSSYGAAPPAPQPEVRNLNVDAAYLHVIGDLVQSIGVAVAGLLIWWQPSWKIADPGKVFCRYETILDLLNINLSFILPPHWILDV